MTDMSISESSREEADERPGETVAAGPHDRWLLGALLAGAGLIHVVMVPTHLDASGVDGVGFLVAGWAQLTLAVLVVAHPRRWVWIATALTSAFLLGAWVVSRTVGLPAGNHAGEAESIAFVDAVAAGLALAAILVAVPLLVAGPRPTSPRRRPTVLPVVGSIAALVFATAAIASPSAVDHAGEDHAHGDASPEHPHDDAPVDDLGFAALANGQMADHHHDGDQPVAASIDPADAATLAVQLAHTARLVEAYPTLAEARAAGYRQAGPFAPGLGTHFNPPNAGGLSAGGVFQPEDVDRAILIYDGLADDAPLAGFMFMAYQGTEPEGFAGDLDRWHYHSAVCIVMTPDGIDTPFGADLTGVTEEMCAAEGGALLDFTGYMVHVWTVPGYESAEGVFSDLNAKLTCPDGTYHQIPTAEIGGRDSTCRDPGPEARSATPQ